MTIASAVPRLAIGARTTQASDEQLAPEPDNRRLIDPADLLERPPCCRQWMRPFGG